MKKPVELLEVHKLDTGKSDRRVKDEVCANSVSAHLAVICDHLRDIVESITDTGADITALRDILSSDKDVIENFFQINMILKGLLLLIEGQDWEKSVESAKHDYSQSTITFLRLVHSANFNVKPPDPPKVVNIE